MAIFSLMNKMVILTRALVYMILRWIFGNVSNLLLILNGPTKITIHSLNRNILWLCFGVWLLMVTRFFFFWWVQFSVFSVKKRVFWKWRSSWVLSVDFRWISRNSWYSGQGWRETATKYSNSKRKMCLFLSRISKMWKRYCYLISTNRPPFSGLDYKENCVY